MRITRASLAAPVADVAPGLLGARLVSTVGGVRVVVRLTEVEAYAGTGEDPGSHAHNGRTAGNDVMFGDYVNGGIAAGATADGVDVRNEERVWTDHPVRTQMTDLARELGGLRTPEGDTPWVRLHYVYPYPHVDAVIPLMAEGLLTPYLDIPFQHAAPSVPKAMKRHHNKAKVP